LSDDILDLIRQMAKENRLWGAERIRGELLKLGVRVSKSCAGFLYVLEICAIIFSKRFGCTVSPHPALGGDRGLEAHGRIPMNEYLERCPGDPFAARNRFAPWHFSVLDSMGQV
jgi:hypothetical protein